MSASRAEAMSRSTTVVSPSRHLPPVGGRPPPAVRSGFLPRAAAARILGRGANDNRLPPARRVRLAIGVLAVIAMMAGMVYLSAAAPPAAP